jgi:hypothetical protein
VPRRTGSWPGLATPAALTTSAALAALATVTVAATPAFGQSAPPVGQPAPVSQPASPARPAVAPWTAPAPAAPWTGAGPAPSTGPTTPLPGAVTPASPAAPAPPVEEPPYDPVEHQGLSEGAWLRATRGTGRRSLGMMITGIGFVTLGASLLAAGSGIAVNGNQCNPMQNFTTGSTFCGAETQQGTGVALLAAGLIALGIGLPLTVLGAADVPRVQAGSVTAPAVPRASVALGLRGAAFALHF